MLKVSEDNSIKLIERYEKEGRKVVEKGLLVSDTITTKS